MPIQVRHRYYSPIQLAEQMQMCSGVKSFAQDDYKYFLPKQDWYSQNFSHLRLRDTPGDYCLPDFTKDVILLETAPSLRKMELEI